MNSFKEQILDFLHEIEKDIAQRMEAKRRNASRRSVASLESIVTENNGTIIGTILSHGRGDAWRAMEEGRKPGPVPRGFHKIIKQWIKDKGIVVMPLPYKNPTRGKGYTPEERGLQSLAARIAYTIQHKGTKLFREHRRDDIYTTPFNERINELKRTLYLSVIEEIHRINRTQI